MVSAVDPDSVQTLVSDVLVPVLASPASPVVQVLDETAVVLEPVLIAVSAVATENVVVAAVEEDWWWWLLLCQVLLSKNTIFKTFIKIISSNPHQHLSHLSLCG